MLQSTPVMVQPLPLLPPGQVHALGLLGPFCPVPVPPEICVMVIDDVLQVRKPAAVVSGSSPLTWGRPACVVMPLYSACALAGLEGAAPPANGAGYGYAFHRL